EAGSQVARARVEVGSAGIDFGTRRIGTAVQERVTVRNVGEREGFLQVSIVSQAPAGQFLEPSVLGGVGLPIPPGEGRPVDLRFAPTTRGSAHATVQLSLASTGPTDSY